MDNQHIMESSKRKSETLIFVMCCMFLAICCGCGESQSPAKSESAKDTSTKNSSESTFKKESPEEIAKKTEVGRIQIQQDRAKGIEFSSDGKSLIKYPRDLEQIHYDIPYGVTYIEEGAFRRNRKLKSVTIPNTVLVIGKAAFNKCLYLETINIPESVVRIDLGAFALCSSAHVTIPASVEYIGSGAVAGVKKLTFHKGNKNFEVDQSGAVFTKGHKQLLYLPTDYAGAFHVPPQTKEIGMGAFLKCEKLTKVVIPEGIEKIDEATFLGCKNLTDVVLPKSLTTIEKEAFAECTALKSISFPDGVKTIGKRAFSGASNLSYVRIPSGIQTIGYSAFYGTLCEKFVKENFGQIYK